MGAFRLTLAGNPNAGKSSIFNHLTGLKQRVGNYPGVTVDKKTGTYITPKGVTCKISDLPGTYSLHPNSQDEYVVVQSLTDAKKEDYPQGILYVADATQLDKQLLLLTQIIDLGIPCALLITMSDLKKEEGIQLDIEKLKKTFEIPIEEISLKKGENIKGIESLIEYLVSFEGTRKKSFTFSIPAYAKEPCRKIKSKLNLASSYHAWLYINHSKKFNFLSEEDQNYIEKIRTDFELNPTRLQIEETMGRYERFPTVLKRMQTNLSKYSTITDRIDSVLTHPTWGPFLFFAFMLLLFQAMYAWSGVPMDWIDNSFAFLSDQIASILPDGIVKDFIIDGIMAGIGGVVIFVPQITILFILLTLFEELGYMSRVVYLFDKILNKFGLNGRSIVAFISSGACAVPAIMSARTITNSKERLITIMTSPLISCSARLPVYAVLIGFVVPDKSVFGFLNAQGLVFMGIYVLSTLVALVVSYILKVLLKSRDKSFLMITLPIYRIPNFRNMWMTVLEKIKTFLFEAGKIILIVSMILWVLGYFGPQNMDTIESNAAQQAAEWNYTSQETNTYIASQKLRHSFLGHIGHFIEPTIKPLGYDWKIGIALVASFAAREVFVGTVATIYSVESGDDETNSIRQRMAQQSWPDGRPVYTMASAVSLILFYMFAMQCMSTLAIVKRETKSWKWPTIQFAYMTVLAYVSAWIAYQWLK